MNALELNELARQFDTVIDCGLFHTFADEERPVFVKGLTEVLRPAGLLHILCFSNERAGTEGPRRIPAGNARRLSIGWTVDRIEPTGFESIRRTDGPKLRPGGPKAWLATIQRT